MKLTYQEMKQLTVGAVHISETENGLSFYKCTQKQIDAWGQLNEGLGQRALTTTGIRLDFHTNSKSLTFTTPAIGKYELHVDGLLHKQFTVGSEDCPVGEPLTAALGDPLGNPKDEVRVTLHLPNHKAGALSSLELDDGSYARRHQFDCKMLMIGDSITQGWKSVYDSYSYAYQLSRYLNAESVIQGIGGAFYHETTFDTLPFAPDIVTVAYGTNDFGKYKTYEDMRAHVAAYLDLIAGAYRGKKIFVFSPIWRDKREGKAMGTFDGACAIVAEEAEKRGMIHIEGLYLVPPLPDFFEDGYLHPNDLGFMIYAANLYAEMSKYLK